MNATDCYRLMLQRLQFAGHKRRVADAASPTFGKDMLEAGFGLQFRVSSPMDNAVNCAPLDRRWAIAHALHFFAATEEAGPLRIYNKHADRFLTGDTWLGAYGFIAVPQLRRCVDILQADMFSRRAIVQMHGAEHSDLNRPSCWNLLHFQVSGGDLDMAVYQRSLNLRVMPYDIVVLSNVMAYVAAATATTVRDLVWTVGNLHIDSGAVGEGAYQKPITLPYGAMSDPAVAWELLQKEHLWTGM